MVVSHVFDKFYMKREMHIFDAIGTALITFFGILSGLSRIRTSEVETPPSSVQNGAL